MLSTSCILLVSSIVLASGFPSPSDSTEVSALPQPTRGVVVRKRVQRKVFIESEAAWKDRLLPAQTRWKRYRMLNRIFAGIWFAGALGLTVTSRRGPVRTASEYALTTGVYLMVFVGAPLAAGSYVNRRFFLQRKAKYHWEWACFNKAEKEIPCPD